MIYKNAELYNVEEIITPENGEGNLFTRVPDRLRVTLNQNAKDNALSPAGCEIRFNLEEGSAKIVLKCEGQAIAEVFQGAFRISQHVVGAEPTEIAVSIPQNMALLDSLAKEKHLAFDPYLTRIILPYTPAIRLMDIEGNIALPRQDQTPEKRYLAYGSSITYGSSAARPTGTYAMRTAQSLGVDLINLGFGGGAHCERQLADYIAHRNDWDFATLELGINMIGSFETEEFKERVEYFIERIAKSHPGKWIFCIDLFAFYADLDGNSTKQTEFREIVRNTVERLNMPKLLHIDGREMLKDVSGLMSDLVHPSPSGMEEIALNLSRLIRKKRK